MVHNLLYNSICIIYALLEFTSEYSKYSIIMKITKLIIETTDLIIVKICGTNLPFENYYKNQTNQPKT